jgi:hypothetical protein
MPTRLGAQFGRDVQIVAAAQKQHLDKYAESVQAPLAAPRRQNEREAEKINSLRAELAPVTEDKDAVIESLRADKETLTAGLADANAENARLNAVIARLTAEKEQLATQVARVAVAPATLVEANSLRLVVGRFDPHDYKTLGVGEPPHPCTNAGKAIKYVLELKNGAGEPVTPPPGFQIRAALHIDGSQTPLTTDEVKWSQRVDGKRGLNDPTWDGRLLWLNVGDPATNVFDMPSGTLEVSAFIYPYSGELKNRKLVIRFTAVNNPLVTPALSLAVINMSRTPNSRKTPQAKKQKTSPPPLALTGPAMATPASAMGPSPPVAHAAPMEVPGPFPATVPAPAPSGADSDSLEFHMDDLMIWAGSGDASTGYMSAPGTPPAGEKNLDGGASAEN